MKLFRSMIASVLLLLAASMPAVAAEPPALLVRVHRILFLGDSITQSGQYVDDIATQLLLRLPDRKFEIINCGLSSETVSGLSEAGHAGGKFPRPDLHERLDRVLAKTQPDLVIACYGMNDGIYLPLSEERFQSFRTGITKLHEKVTAAGVPIIHLTPPVFDPLPIQSRVAKADRTDADHPFEDYNKVLDAYSNWLLEQRKEGWKVIDIHAAISTLIQKNRATQPQFTFSRDGVHPNDAGHAVMANTVLEFLGIPAISDAELAANSQTKFAKVQKLIRQRDRLMGDAWLTDIGHKRPMKPGLPLDTAREKAAQIDAKIDQTLASP